MSAVEGKEPTTDNAPLVQCAFNVLGVSARDNRGRIVEAAEERSLTSDAPNLSKARADLTNPRNRLAAELSWMPGVSPRRAEQLVRDLQADPDSAFSATGLPPLANANLLASAIPFLDPDLPEAVWEERILQLATMVSSIVASNTLAYINEDRTVAGFPEIKSVEAIEEGLEERRREYRDYLRKALDRLEPRKLARVVGVVTEKATDHGRKHPEALVDDLVDSYAVGVHGFLSQEAENVAALIGRIEQSAQSGEAAVRPLLERLERTVENWYHVAKPVQLVASAKGTSHPASADMAASVRGLGVLLYNEHSLVDATRRLNQLLSRAFGAMPEMAEKAQEDAQRLEKLAKEKESTEKAKPLQELCRSAIDQIERDPLAGQSQARRVLEEGKPIVASLRRDSLDAEFLDLLEDTIAITVFRCAIALGNKSDKWEAPAALLQEARLLAHDQDLIGRIEQNLATARQNHRLFGDLAPIVSAPTLYRINGCGFGVYGSADRDQETGSYMTTYYFCLLFFPVFPICRYRVTSSGDGYRFLGKGPLRPFDKAHLAISIIVILVLIISNR